MPAQSAATTAESSPRLEGVDPLLVLTRGLTAINSAETLREALAGSLRPLLPSRDISVLRSVQGVWEVVAGPADAPDRVAHYAWTPLVNDNKTIGMLGIGASAAGLPPMNSELATALLALAAQKVIAIENLRQDSVRDGLTGCFNRAHAMETLEANLRRANRTSFPVSIVMIDIDEFKAINDRFGHVPGDAVLAGVADQLRRMLRQSDVRCRLGGDEFLVILPETPFDDALRVAESIRHAIEELVVPSVRGDIRLTASLGVAAWTCGAAVDVAAFMDRADVALYRAKQAGRNTVGVCRSSSVRPRPTPLRLAAKPA